LVLQIGIVTTNPCYKNSDRVSKYEHEQSVSLEKRI